MRVLSAIRVACAVGVLACLVWSVSALLKGGLGAGDKSSVLSLLATAVLWIAAEAEAYRRRTAETQTEDLVGGLAAAVEAVEQEARLQALNRDTRPIDVAFRLDGGGRRAAAGAAATGSLTGIADYYRSLSPRRLAVTGAAGAGKTVLSVELVLGLLESRAEDDPVPVRLSATTWDAAQDLDDWLAEQVSQVHGLPRAGARQLVKGRRVLPVLDGLDEMDTAGTAPEDSRTAELLRRLNTAVHGRDRVPVIISCRSDLYDALPPKERLLDAARITVQHLTAGQELEFLSSRPEVDPETWEPVLDELRARPDGALADALNSPWRLTLAVAAYGHDGDPARMLALADDGELHEHLLSRYIPAMAALHSESGEYRPDDVHGWLTELAWHYGGGGGYDVELAGKLQRVLRIPHTAHAALERLRSRDEEIFHQMERVRTLREELENHRPDLTPEEWAKNDAEVAELEQRLAGVVRDRQWLQDVARGRDAGQADLASTVVDFLGRAHETVGNLSLTRLWPMAALRRIRAWDAVVLAALLLLAGALFCFGFLVPPPPSAWPLGAWAAAGTSVVAGVALTTRAALRLAPSDPRPLRTGALRSRRGRRAVLGTMAQALSRAAVVAVAVLFTRAAILAADAPVPARMVLTTAAGMLSCWLLRPARRAPGESTGADRKLWRLWAIYVLINGAVIGAAASTYRSMAVCATYAALCFLALCFDRPDARLSSPSALPSAEPSAGLRADLVRTAGMNAYFSLFLFVSLSTFIPPVRAAVVLTGLVVLATAMLAVQYRRYLLALVLLRDRLPLRLTRFLGWAYGAGLLRIAGRSYQFRHRELHDWLIRSRITPPDAPDTTAGPEPAGPEPAVR